MRAQQRNHRRQTGPPFRPSVLRVRSETIDENTGASGEQRTGKEGDTETQRGGQHAACRRAYEDPDALQPCHYRDRATDLLVGAGIGDIGLPPKHPGSKTGTDHQRRHRNPRNGIGCGEQQRADQNQDEPAQQYRLVPEARNEHSGRNVEQEHAHAPQADDDRRECRREPELHDVHRKQDHQRHLAG